MGRLSLVKKVLEKKGPAKAEKPKPVEKVIIPKDERTFSEKLFDIGPAAMLRFPSGLPTKAGWIVEFHSTNRNSFCLKLYYELEALCAGSGYKPTMEKDYKELLTSFDLIASGVWAKRDKLTILQMRELIIKLIREYQCNMASRIALVLI
jgi:hypothetical protein